MLTREDKASERHAVNRTVDLSAQPNTDLAVAFLSALDGKGRHDLTAIRPKGGIETATFTARTLESARRWIDARQGVANLYYSVNGANPDAPFNNKLKKEHIGFIRAVVIDLDPVKVKGGEATGEHFARERKRLLAVLRGAADDPKCPPTLCIDSGGGFQGIWKLDPAVPATPENSQLAEGIGRTLARRLGGDPGIWNIDRIMRLPGTVNVPTPDKAAQGRKPATATVLMKESERGNKTFTLAQLAEWAPPLPVSSKERGASRKNDTNVVDLNVRADPDNPVDWDVVKVAESYDDLPLDLRKTFEEQYQLDPKLRALYEDGTLPPGHTDDSGSGYSFALARCLKQTGAFTPTQFGQLLWVWPHSPDRSKINRRAIWRDWQRAASEEAWGTPADLWASESATPRLPEEVVPDIVDRLARDWGRRLGVEPGAPAAALITTLGSLVSAGNVMQLRQKDTGWKVKPIIWTAIIGEPGSNKSATIARAIEPVEHVEARWRGQHAAAKRKANAQFASGRTGTRAQASELPATVAEIFDSADTSITDVPYRQKIVNDTTIEALGQILAEQPSGVLCYVDELAGLIGGMDAYRTKGGKDRSFWLEAKEGKPRTINRATGTRRIFVPNNAVSVIGGIQPSKIKSLSANLTEDGLLQRFMPILIERQGAGVDDYPDEEAERQLHALALAIADRSEQTAIFKFAPVADAELRALEAFKMHEIERPNVGPGMRQWLDKLPNEFGRIALVFHQIEWHTSRLDQSRAEIPELVSQETARRARRFLIEFVVPHARAFYEGVVGQSLTEAHAQWVAGFILSRRRGVIDARDIYKNYTPFKKPERRGDLLAVMYDLEMQDWVKPVARDGAGKQISGRSTLRFTMAGSPTGRSPNGPDDPKFEK
jgi:Protein of unknown function (DUF3987)